MMVVKELGGLIFKSLVYMCKDVRLSVSPIFIINVSILRNYILDIFFNKCYKIVMENRFLKGWS